jgi:hypothetical protein
MTRKLDALREKRRKWVEATQENDFEDGIKRLLTDLYPDNAHFIYELLQNAEDPGATTVRFVLSDSAVEFEHDGERLFSLKDVESITSIGSSNKRDDPTSIGKFGVGFKAVFAYSNTPEIHSGDFHFRIQDLVVPETDGVPCPAMGERNTRFVFPFDNPKKPKTHAVAEVERGLRALGDNTLLFLSHIRRIEYVLPDGAEGSLERIQLDGGRIKIHSRQPGMAEQISHWLRFDEEVEVTDEDGKNKTCRIAIVYSLAEDKNTSGRLTWRIVSLDRAQVSIYFPAEKETSNLHFHVHAPFASTVARDSVRDCVANNVLLDSLAQLAAKSLVAIREHNLLTVGFLAVLPSPEDKLSPFYEPIREAIVKKFKEAALVPVRVGGHASARDLIRCPAKLVEELSDDDISVIAGKPLKVAANPPQLNQREDRFLKSLGISDWGWKQLNIALSTKARREDIENWLQGKDNDSLAALYGLLKHSKEQVKEWNHYSQEYQTHMNVVDLRIVRSSSDSSPIMCRPKETFFPLDETPFQSDIQFVEPLFCSGDSRAFLEGIGVRPYDEKATIEQILESYESPRAPKPDHIDHIKRFVSFSKKSPGEVGIFKGRRFLLHKERNGDLIFYQPSKLYLDKPYSETLLSAYFESLPEESRSHLTLSADYHKAGLICEEFSQFAKEVGVTSALQVKPLLTVSNNPNRTSLRTGGNKQRHDHYKRVERDFDIPEFEILLQHPDTSRSRLVWKTMATSVSKEHFQATYQRNNNSEEKHANSILIHRLRVAAWVPQENGRFVTPSKARARELPAGFSFDPGQDWLKAIGFGDDEKRHSEEYQARDSIAREAGLSSGEELAAYLDAIKESGLTPEQIRAVGKQQKKISQPEESVKDPERRRRGVREGGDSAPPKESVVRERSIQPDAPEIMAVAKAYLRAKYKNDEGQLVCQCCHEEMPFKLRTGEHYFEAIQCVRNQDSHYYQNRLALCPTCAAMYQYARDTEDTEVRRRLVEHAAVDQAPSVEIPIRLANREHSLYFVGTHWFDLKTVLNAPEVQP